jgi:senataxin
MCTLNTAGSQFLRNAAGKHFHTLLLDEGGQCPEAEFYICTTFPGVRRIIVVGDPQQLPATVIDPRIQHAGYGASWMSHVSEVYPRKIHLLDTQYRMDPEILKFPNASFYSGRIMSGENVFGRSPYVEFPFRFIDTAKCGQEEEDKYSFKNAYEAAVIKSLLKSDSDILRVRKSDPHCRIIIITPYKAQVDLLESTLSDTKGVGSVSIATVDSFQGQEAPVVIVSTVRTESAGFVDSAQRLNVSLTRAQ